MIILLAILSFLAASFALGMLFTAVLQDRFIFWGNGLNEDHLFNHEISFRELFIQGIQNARLHAIWVSTPQTPRNGVVLFFHGNTGNLSRWLDVAHQFTERGYDVLMPDYRGFGKSKGVQNEHAFYQDALLWYDEIKKEVSDQQIIVFGKSIGSAAASYVAAHRAPRTVLLETPFSSMKNLFYTYYPFLPRVFFFKYTFDNALHLSKANSPLHIIAAGKDLVVPLRCSSKLKKVLKPGDTFTLIEEGQHNDLAMYRTFQQFLNRHLPSDFANHES